MKSWSMQDWARKSVFVVVALCATSQAVEAQTKERVAAARKMAADEARSIELSIGKKAEEKCELLPRPLLYWTNPVNKEVYGSVYLWTHKGRPAALGSLYRFYSPKKSFSIEMQSLSEQRLLMQKEGSTVWKPSRGLRFTELPDSSKPSSTSSVRRLQVKSLAQRFVADQIQSDGLVTRLRLLSKPLFVYPKSDDIEGSLFSIGEGTNPEVLLLIEARKHEDRLRWEYAIGRLSTQGLRVTLDDTVVYQVNPCQRPLNRPEEPYSILLRILN